MAKAIQVYQDSPMKQNVDCHSFNAQEFIEVGRNDFSGAVLKHGEDSDCYLTSSSLSSSCPSSELEEDASSSPSFSPLFHLCELMAQLPIK
ncbi:hypothetical protein LIER_39391 [Lithospermum erythrorhizon]|uniref:Uncharacterized protein n=1 Tax=Lithospermum erythrorhizon TaxID=34254 RepID=A0AAV3QH30_LITER